MTKSIAAILMAGIAALHTFAGGPTVHQPLLGAAPDTELALYVSLLWHFVTLFLIATAITFALAARDRRYTPMAQITALLTIGMGLLFLGYGFAYLNTPWVAPQWTLLLPVAALVFLPKGQTA